MSIHLPVEGIEAVAGSPAVAVTADLPEIVALRRERFFEGADLMFDGHGRDVAPMPDGEIAQAWQRLARQRLGIGTALIDLANALAYAIDVGPQIILYRVMVARGLPRQLDLGNLFAAGEVAAARFAANGVVEWVPIVGALDVPGARLMALRQGATPLGRVFTLGSLAGEGGLRLSAVGQRESLTLDLLPPSVGGRFDVRARRFAWHEQDTPMSYGFGAPAAEQMPVGLAALFALPWH
ncbi:MAG: hypothetical protein JNL25_17685 [Rhodospirillaceae bacterium]|nr:hypothetical protein [Rhodospirillaceae bacterium]